jgi:hypothetical protein
VFFSLTNILYLSIKKYKLSITSRDFILNKNYYLYYKVTNMYIY